VTDDTAWTLAGDKAWRLGLFKAAVGLGDRVMLGTYTLVWPVRAANAFLKWRFYEGDTFHWAVQATAFRLDLSRFFPDKEDPGVIAVGSLSVLSSVRLSPALQLSNSLVSTAVRLRGNIDTELWGGFLDGGVSNVTYVGALEWRWSQTTALIVTGRYLMAQILDANGRISGRLDEYTTVEGELEGDTDRVLDFRGAFSILPAFVWSWRTFNLELGIGYGNLYVPALNFTLPARSVIGALDLYWTF
jgi:hypothetical protein